MGTLKQRLRSDLTDATKARDTLVRDTLRLTLAAVQTTEVAGDTPRELSDDEVLAVISTEAKKRREAASAYDDGARPELAAAERAEGEVLARYLPLQLTDAELTEIVQTAVADSGAQGMKQMGQAMKAAQAVVGRRAEGGRIAAAVRAQLSG